jgi:hypothetical protein
MYGFGLFQTSLKIIKYSDNSLKAAYNKVDFNTQNRWFNALFNLALSFYFCFLF